MEEKKAFSADLIEDRIVVWNSKEGSELYKMGFFGKPLGIAKPKMAEFDAPVNIDLIEGLYLLEKGIINVYNADNQLQFDELKDHARNIYDNFDLNYRVYKDLREHGYVVIPGIKFGCEYAIYEHGPGIDHSPYMVSVRTPGEKLTSTDIVRAGRLATSVRKRFIIALPNPETDQINYIMFKWFKA
jgi:tRNA-intron endonuclease